MTERQYRNMIVAYDNERAIGSSGDIPWFGSMKEDMRHFRRLTMDTTVIMGRKTLESIGMALPRRRNIVLTRGGRIDLPGVDVAESLDEAYGMARDDETFILGGGQIYEQALEGVGRIYATHVDTTMSNPDTWFPDLDPQEWRVAERTNHDSDEDNIYPYSFVTYQRP